MNWGYDIDGVLAEQPPASTKKWGRMNGEERKERQNYLLRWYLTAEPLYNPPHNATAISARKHTPEIQEITNAWLATHRPQITHFYLLTGTRTLDNVATYKANIIKQQNITHYVEDNKQILKRLAKLLDNTTLYHWEKGMQEPQPYV